MARDDAETGRPKAAIPDNFQPAPGTGSRLSNHFLSVDSLRESTPLQGSEIDRTAQERDRHNRGAAFVAGDSDQAAPGFLLTGAQATARKSHMTVIEQRKRDDERFASDQMKAALDARLAALDAELLALDTRIGEIEQRRIAIGDNLEALDELVQIERSGQKIDPNNPEHARLLRKAGIDPDKADKATLAEIIARRRRELGLEDEALDAEWNAKMKRRGQVATEREAVAGARDEIERANTDEARILAERRAATMLGAQQIGEAASQTESRSAKIIAADAVAANERPDLRADSETYNRRAALADRNSVVDASGKDFEQDSATTSTMRPAPLQPK